MALKLCLLYRRAVFSVAKTRVRAALMLLWLGFLMLGLVTVSCDRSVDSPLPGSEEAPIQITQGGMTYEPGDGGATVQPADVASVEPAADTTVEPSDDD